jgi:hypothetical protein
MAPSAATSYTSNPMQQPFDAAVVITTVCRPSLLRAVGSVFRQLGVGRIQVLIGIDAGAADASLMSAVLADRPPQHAVTVLDLGYSTSVRHGGVHAAIDGGALRTILTYCANSPFVTYLDDDNWLHETHIAALLAAIRDRDWAYTLRYFVDPETMEVAAVDRWESVGPGRGVFEKMGGFVDPNCLMIDKLKCDSMIRFWATPLPGGERLFTDRSVFEMLRRRPAVGFTGAATVYYLMGANDADKAMRMALLREMRRRYGEAPLMSLAPLSVWSIESVAGQEQGA